MTPSALPYAKKALGYLTGILFWMFGIVLLFVLACLLLYLLMAADDKARQHHSPTPTPTQGARP